MRALALALCFAAGAAQAQQVSNPTPLNAVDNNTALKAFRPPSQNASMVRRGFTAAGDAPTFQYRYSNAPCSMNAGNGDDGAQVKAADGNCWLAQIAGPEVDVRQWGAQADNGTTDNAALIVKALTAAAGKYCIVVPQSAGNYYAIKTAIVLPTGFNSCLKSPQQWATLTQPNDTNLASMITGTGAAGILLENIELNGNGDNNPNGGPAIKLDDPATADVTLNNLYVHDAPQHGALIGGAGIHINGGYYVGNGRTPGTASGMGIALTTGASNFQISGTTVNSNATTGIGCIGSCHDGVIDGNISYNNGAGVPPNVADNITGYNAANYNVVISNNVVRGGGNAGIHFGGNNITYVGNSIDTPANWGIAHTSAKLYSIGTVTCSGTGAIVGVGTSWASQYPYNLFTADGLQITVDGVTNDVLRVFDNTNLQLNAGTCAAGSGKAYQLRGFVASSNVNITGNTITGIVTPYAAIYVDQVAGGVIGNNVSLGGNGDGVALFGVSAVNVTGNTMANKPGGSGVLLTADRYYNTGTVAVTNGSAAVVGTGTTWVANVSPWNGNSVLMVAGDTTNYTVVAVADNTHLTLDRPFTGTTSASKAYAVATGISDHNLISGNALTNNLVGVSAKASSYNTISGNHIGCTLATATCDTYTGVLGVGSLEFADAILGNNFPRMKFWQQVDNVNNSIGPNARDQTPLGPILPKNCTLQMSGAMYNNTGAFAICP